jgi:hypothetical protein
VNTWDKIIHASELHFEIDIPVSEISEKKEKEKVDRKRERLDKGTFNKMMLFKDIQ